MKSMKDVMQEIDGICKEPEIRVWCHPNNDSDDDYYVSGFKTLQEAIKWIKNHPKKLPEEYPLIAINGKEYNLFIE